MASRIWHILFCRLHTSQRFRQNKKSQILPTLYETAKTANGYKLIFPDW